MQSAAGGLERGLLAKFNPSDFGLRFDPIRSRALAASEGSTDFGVLFLSFSFFLIASAAMLVALMFRLSVERRAAQIGLLLAQGFSTGVCASMFIAEGAALSVLGAGLGAVAARGYAILMLHGLQSRWSAAVHAPTLVFHGNTWSYCIGIVCGIGVALVSCAWALRGLTKRSARSLIAGEVGLVALTHPAPTRRWATVGAGIMGLLALIVLLVSTLQKNQGEVLGFFVASFLLLVATLLMAARWLTGLSRHLLRRPGLVSIIRLGVRNAPRHRGRSLLTVALIACATFLIVALESLRFESGPRDHGLASGTGGFGLLAETTVPLLADLNNPASREDLGLQAIPPTGVTFVPFRLQSGDEASCLNLYRPTKPRVLGVSDAMVARGGFRFSDTLAVTDAERKNPWLLLEKPLGDDVVPAIADEAAARWQLHKGLGQELDMSDAQGKPFRLRFVALLKDSVLQSEMMIAESSFTRRFPAVSGYSFYLIDCPPEDARRLEQSLEQGLTRFGLDCAPTAERLAAYLAVQNTYLSAFQLLGAIGLLLGTAGSAAVLLRNVLERRRELALMQALGFTRADLSILVLAENLALLIVGLAAGVLSATVSVAPRVITSLQLPWQGLAAIAGLLLATGVVATLLAATMAFRAPLLDGLRAE